MDTQTPSEIIDSIIESLYDMDQETLSTLTDQELKDYLESDIDEYVNMMYDEDILELLIDQPQYYRYVAFHEKHDDLPPKAERLAKEILLEALQQRTIDLNDFKDKCADYQRKLNQ